MHIPSEARGRFARHRTGLLAALPLCVGIWTSAAPAQAATAGAAQAPIMEQAALDLLKKMSDTLAAAPSFRVDVRDMREVPTTPGQMLTLISDAEVQLQRPDKLRIEAVVGEVDTLYLFDGAKLSILDKPKNLFVSEALPGDLDQMLATASKSFGLQFSLHDFLVKDPYAVLSKNLTHAYVAGNVTLDDSRTTQLVFAAPGVEFQLWIDQETSLPKLMTMTYLDTRRPTHFSAEFDDWEIGAKADADAFVFSPPSGAKPIKFLPGK